MRAEPHYNTSTLSVSVRNDQKEFVTNELEHGGASKLMQWALDIVMNRSKSLFIPREAIPYLTLVVMGALLNYMAFFLLAMDPVTLPFIIPLMCIGFAVILLGLYNIRFHIMAVARIVDFKQGLV